MNLFKILANGYGSVNENNVSAFFAYLLDPNENHSLDSEFLSRFTNDFFDDDFNINLYDTQIFLEQAFKNEDKVERVDIVIVFYRTDIGTKHQSYLTSFIKNIKNNKQIEEVKVILIENKITKGALNPNQVKRQRQLAQLDLNIKAENIHSVYLTPDEVNFSKEYEKLGEKYATHFLWRTNDNDKNSVVKILKNILQDESIGNIEPISDYTKQTIKGFIQFVEADFKSENKIKEERKNGLYAKNIYDTLEEFLEKQIISMDETILKRIKQFIQYLEGIEDKNGTIEYRFSKTFPLSIFYNKKKIMGIHKSGNYELLYGKDFEEFNFVNQEIENNFTIITSFEKGVRVRQKDNDDIFNLFDVLLKGYKKLI